MQLPSFFKLKRRFSLKPYLLIAAAILLTQVVCAQKAGKQKIDSLMVQLANVKNDTARCNIYYQLSNTWLNRNPITSEEYAAKLIALAQKTKFQKGIAQAYKNYAEIYRNQPDFDRSVNYYKKSIKISESAHANALLAETYTSLGFLYADQFRLNDALENFKKSAFYSLLSNKPEILLEACKRAGAVYEKNKAYPEEFAWLNQLLPLTNHNIICRSYLLLCFGDAFSSQKDYKNTLKNYKAAEELVQTTNSSNAKGDVADRLAYYYYGELKDTVNFRNYIQRAANYYSAVNPLKEALEWSDAGYWISNSKTHAVSTQYYEKAISIYNNYGDDEAAKAYENIAIVKMSERKWDDALKNLQKSLQIEVNSQNKVWEAGYDTRIGAYFVQYGRSYLDALKYYERSLAILGQMKLFKSQSGVFFSIASTYLKLKDYNHALYYVKQSADLTKRLGDKAANNIANVRLASIYTQTHNYQDALKANKEVEKYYVDVNLPYGISGTRIHISSIYQRLNDNNSALLYAQKAFTVVEHERNESAVGRAEINLAKAYYNRKNYTQSLNLVNRSLAIDDGDLDKGGAYVTLGLIIRDAPDSILIRAGVLPSHRYNKAAENLIKGHDISQGNSDLDLDDETEYWGNLALVYEKGKDLDNAYVAYKKHIAFRDSSDKESDQANFKENETRINFTRHEDSVKFQDNLTNERLKQQSLLVIQQKQDLTINRQKIDLQQADIAAKQSKLSASQKAQEATQANFELQKTELNAKRVQSRYFIGGLTVLILLSFFIARNYVNQRRANQTILAANKEINVQKTVAEESLHQLKETQKQLVQSEKMASLGELTAGIAHEIQNPLNFVNNFSDVSIELIDEMQEELNKGDKDEAIAISEDIKQNLEKIRHHGNRADGIVKGMLQHSRANSGAKEPTDLNTLSDEYLRLAYHGLRAKDKSFNVELVTNFNDSLPKVNVVPQDIGRVMLNLFTNAFYAVQQKQKTAGADYKPTVEISTFAPSKGGWGAKVTDNGTGIPDDIKDKILQPFFTTKPTGEGTGLGLSLSYDILVKGHGGSIEIQSAVGQGSEFIVTLRN